MILNNGVVFNFRSVGRVKRQKNPVYYTVIIKTTHYARPFSVLTVNSAAYSRLKCSYGLSPLTSRFNSLLSRCKRRRFPGGSIRNSIWTRRAGRGECSICTRILGTSAYHILLFFFERVRGEKSGESTRTVWAVWFILISGRVTGYCN